MENVKVIFALSGIFIFWAFSAYRTSHFFIMGLKSKQWPSTGGTVTASKVVNVEDPKNSFEANRYNVIFKYEYSVENIKYTAERFSFGESATYLSDRGPRSKKGADYLVAKYPLASHVTVYYQPDNPENAVLVPGVKNVNLILMVIITGITGILAVGFPLGYIYELLVQ